MYYKIDPISTSIVPLAEVKAYPLRRKDNNDDAVIQGLLIAAEQFIENETGLILQERNGTAFFDSFDNVLIEKRPNVNVTGIQYYNSDKVMTTITTDDFVVDDLPLDSMVTFGNFPKLGRTSNAVKINFTVGYGSANVPILLKQAIKGMVAYWYQQPSPVVTGTIVAQLPLHVQSIIYQYRVVTP